MVLHQRRQVVQGIGIGQSAGLDQAGQDIAHVGAMFVGIEEAVFAQAWTVPGTVYLFR